MEFFLRLEYADISLLGGREENQDRVAVAVAEKAVLLLVVDGMGGHADGARAAQVTQQVILDAFWHTPQPLFDPLGFLHLTLGRAHEQVVKLGVQLPLEQRPRATCAVCLVQQRASWWAHVGDSRLYHLRRGALLVRSRDHSHVELLLACTDGLWGPLTDTEIATEVGTPGELRAKLLELGARAVQRAGSGSDNTSAAALRWLGD